MGKIYIGISGWRYAPWRGVFYPKGLPQRLELAYASRTAHSIELNGSFYSLQRPQHYEQWHDETPPGFVFAVKGPRYVTHVLRLKGAEQALANFFASGLFKLRDKLGPLLWQFPPSFRFEPQTFDAFLRLLPQNTGQALALARRRDERMKGRACLAIDAERPLRHAVEVRHDSFLDPAFVKLLRRHKVALVVADTAGKWPWREDVTGDFVYMRLHGDQELYASGYSPEALSRWAERMERWARGDQPADARLIDPERAPRPRASRDVYCYFDNDAKVHAPFDAAGLRSALGLPAPAVAPGQPWDAVTERRR
ncbi:DUF72 domain-containing protein [Schlegelella sp. S2-27]|uniref:DUF72 domain-containing protein n=1 Tax=Caldimonas mangrovi TaxID=2944811 RepID=A0ABT0YLB7_9BURK|nr:DUF72 domain-containing protein [Caldimonas mangrovi]MCM5679515.1 DUF72 domain-containing protein [Caldimonas mangrovi]